MSSWDSHGLKGAWPLSRIHIHEFPMPANAKTSLHESKLSTLCRCMTNGVTTDRESISTYMTRTLVTRRQLPHLLDLSNCYTNIPSVRLYFGVVRLTLLFDTFSSLKMLCFISVASDWNNRKLSYNQTAPTIFIWFIKKHQKPKNLQLKIKTLSYANIDTPLCKYWCWHFLTQINVLHSTVLQHAWWNGNYIMAPFSICSVLVMKHRLHDMGNISSNIG